MLKINFRIIIIKSLILLLQFLTKFDFAQIASGAKNPEINAGYFIIIYLFIYYNYSPVMSVGLLCVSKPFVDACGTHWPPPEAKISKIIIIHNSILLTFSPASTQFPCISMHDTISSKMWASNTSRTEAFPLPLLPVEQQKKYKWLPSK